MTKIFEFNKGQSGSLIDSVSKNKLTVGGSPEFKKTERGLAMSFDGSSNYLDCGDNIDMDLSINNYTVSAWIKMSEITDGLIISKRTNAGYEFGIDGSGYISWYIKDVDNNVAFDVANSDTVNDGEWYHIVYVLTSGSDVKRYIDGVNSGTNGSISDIDDCGNATNLFIGARDKSPVDKLFNGSISNVQIYNHALTLTEIQRLYQQGLHSYGTTEQKRNFTYPKPTDLSSEVDSKVGEQLVTNGDMELDSNWTDYASPTTNERSTTIVHNGTYSRHVVSDVIDKGVVSDNFNVVSGNKYKVTGWIYVVSGQGRIQAGSGRLSIDTTVTTTGEWVNVSGTYTATSSGTDSMLIRSQAGAAEFYIDDFSVQELTGLVAAYNMIPSNGTLVDISGNGNDGTISGALSTKDGMGFDGGIDIGNVPVIDTLPAFTFATRIKTDSSSRETIFHNAPNVGNKGIYLDMMANGTLRFFNGNDSGSAYVYVTTTNSYNDGLKHDVVITNTGTEGIKIYIDGVIIDFSVNTSGSFSLPLDSTQSFEIGITWGSSDNYTGEMDDLKIYNYAFTSQQAKDYHNSFKTPTLIESFENNGADGIVKTPRGWTKGTGDYKVEEIAIEEGELVTNGTFDTDSDWIKGTGWTISDGKAHCDGSQTGNSHLYQTNVYTLRKRYRFKVTISNYSAGTVKFSTGSQASGTFNSNGVKIFDVTPHTYNNVYLSANSTFIGSIDNASVTEIPPLPNFDTGTKFLENDSAGTIATQQTSAYGTWEFDFFNAGDIMFISNKNDVSGDGYWFRISGTQQLVLSRIDSGSEIPLGFSSMDYISNNTWYRVKVARLQSEGVFKDIPTLQESDCENGDYTTFTSNGRYGFSATSDGGATHEAGTADEIDVVNGEKYLVEFDLKLNSGAAPTLALAEGTGSNIEQAINGRNSHILIANSTKTAMFQFKNTATATDYEVSGLTIRRIYDADTFAVFIKGGEFGDIYTLVDTTGGSGTNPITDSTYTTSQYLVTDLDNGDKISNIKTTNGVLQ